MRDDRLWHPDDAFWSDEERLGRAVGFLGGSFGWMSLAVLLVAGGIWAGMGGMAAPDASRFAEAEEQRIVVLARR